MSETFEAIEGEVPDYVCVMIDEMDIVSCQGFVDILESLNTCFADMSPGDLWFIEEYIVPRLDEIVDGENSPSAEDIVSLFEWIGMPVTHENGEWIFNRPEDYKHEDAMLKIRELQAYAVNSGQ